MPPVRPSDGIVAALAFLASTALNQPRQLELTGGATIGGTGYNSEVEQGIDYYPYLIGFLVGISIGTVIDILYTIRVLWNQFISAIVGWATNQNNTRPGQSFVRPVGPARPAILQRQEDPAYFRLQTAE